MDQLDKAQILEEADREHGIDAVLHRSVEEQARDAAGVIRCLDCDAAIDAERLAVLPTACRCVECQQIHEKTERRYA